MIPQKPNKTSPLPRPTTATVAFSSTDPQAELKNSMRALAWWIGDCWQASPEFRRKVERMLAREQKGMVTA